MSKGVYLEKSQEPQLLIHGLKGLCDLLGISMKTACHLTKRLPHYRAGRKIYYKQDEILVFMSKNNQPVKQ
ncbi:helix-turn-helix domain-containing protein [bacterium]|nr:helix-turn-helix domain-containing protein [bacterium]